MQWTQYRWNTDEHRNKAEANQYFLQLPQENRQVNVFVNDPRMQVALELRAERRHEFVLDNLYAETPAFISHLEATADANHRQQPSFVRESKEVLVGQLHNENRVYRQLAETEHQAVQGLRTQLTCRDQVCRDERSVALQLGAQHSEVEMHARTLLTSRTAHFVR